MPPKQGTAAANEQQQRQAHLDNHANQLNSNNVRYNPQHQPPGYVGNEAASQLRARQLNPNNPLYQAPKTKQ